MQLMHETQKAILKISQQQDLAFVGIRELARMLKVHPQTAKHHLGQLIKKGLLRRGSIINSSIVYSGTLDKADLVAIPYMGAANCGPASLVTQEAIEGYINVSSRLLDTDRYDSLFAVRAEGDSMNQARIKGQNVENGDYVVVDSGRIPQKHDYVLATINNLANLKKYLPEQNAEGHIQRIALLSESAVDYEPIFIHPDDATGRLIAGVAIQVIKSAR